MVGYHANLLLFLIYAQYLKYFLHQILITDQRFAVFFSAGQCLKIMLLNTRDDWFLSMAAG
jgi:hypothetical protein